MKTDKILVRQGSKTKAALAVGAAIAVLLGGASTFARWAQDVELASTGDSDAEITAGEWKLDTATGTLEQVGWWDVSPEATETFVYGTNGYAPDHDFDDYEWGAIEGESEGVIEAWKIDETLFRTVPGDEFIVLYDVTIADIMTDVELTGEHLDVMVYAIADDGLAEVDALPYFVGEVVAYGADDDYGTGDTQIAVKLTYAMESNAGDGPGVVNMATCAGDDSWNKDYCDQHATNALPSGLDISKLSVTIVQKRDAYALP